MLNFTITPEKRRRKIAVRITHIFNEIICVSQETEGHGHYHLEQQQRSRQNIDNLPKKKKAHFFLSYVTFKPFMPSSLYLKLD